MKRLNRYELSLFAVLAYYVALCYNMTMKTVSNNLFTGERALFKQTDLNVTDCTFADGESPLKECCNITVNNCDFKWKYPLWYGKNVCVADSRFAETARAGIWYTDGIKISRRI